MKKSELKKALRAYLKGTANSWQQFILEDYFDSFKYCFNVLDVYSEEQLLTIKERLYAEIEIKIDAL